MLAEMTPPVNRGCGHASASSKPAPRSASTHFVGGKQRIVASQIVGEMLPALDQSGRHVEPGEVGRGLDQDQQAAGRKQIVQARAEPIGGRCWRGQHWPIR